MLIGNPTQLIVADPGEECPDISFTYQRSITVSCSIAHRVSRRGVHSMSREHPKQIPAVIVGEFSSTNAGELLQASMRQLVKRTYEAVQWL